MPDSQHNSPPDNRPHPQQVLFAIALFLLIVISAVSLWQQTRPEALEIRVIPPPPTFTPTPTATPGPVTVYVSGAVHKPQVLGLPSGSRVRDAIEAAGGALAGADLILVNLAEPLRDGMQVHVPHQAVPTPILATGDPRLRINQASAEELQGLPGVGPVLAQRIVEHRATQGPFADLTALDEVAGIGPALLRQLKSRLRFD